MRSRAAVALIATALALTTAATAAPAAAARRVVSVSVHQVFTVPSTGKFRLAGHGFGHGHGMSQYGAEGAARKGLSYQRILAFYYPHTSLGTGKGSIRVLITGDTSDGVRVVATKGLRVVDAGSKTSYALPYRSDITKWRMVVRDGNVVVDYHTNAWHRFAIGPEKLAHLAGNGTFRSASGVLRLITPSGKDRYRGGLRGVRASAGARTLDTVNVLSLDDYVRGVVPLEMPTTWHTAAVRAQAVAARTYAMFERAENRHRYYQICDTSRCQVYGGMDAETTEGNAAVTATAGRYVSYRGGPAFTQFSSSSGGWTSAGSQPYLPAQKDTYDGWSGNPVHSWSVKVRADVLEKRYPRIGTLKKITITGRAGGGQWHGRVLTVKLTGSKHSGTVHGSAIAAAYGLRSTWFMPQRAG
ncbi:MAG TPA: SpoIID/LytB domain-containing protein [Marmoricola sp.]